MLVPTNAGFIDSSTGRQVLLRGVNLSGSSKAPPNEPTHYDDDFWTRAESASHSFLGRPFELDEADEHLRRLKGWGFNFIRYPVTWESLEREGPGKYDYAFMDETIEILKKCHEWGFYVYMDPHQDVWSRFTGGSGAPFWTLPLLGIDCRAIHPTLAAVVHHEWTPEGETTPDPSQIPSMIWSTNYGRLICHTAFTMFWASKDYAPLCTVDGISVGEWMQNRFCEAFGKLADRISENAPELLDECIIGWDGMNEPFEGLICYPDLTALPTKQGGVLKKGPTPTPIEGMRLGMGISQTVENWDFRAFGPTKSGSITVDPKGAKLWVDSLRGKEWDDKWGWQRGDSWKLGTCPWALHGVWDIQTGYCMKKDYFSEVVSDGDVNTVDISSPTFLETYWTPFFTKFARRIRQAHSTAILLVQPPVFAIPPSNIPRDLLERAAYAPHYYDGLTLVSKHWNWFNADALGLIRGKYSSPLPAVKIGEWAIRKSLREQLAMFIDDTKLIVRDGEDAEKRQRSGPLQGDAGEQSMTMPVIIGEIGTPMDMDDKRSYYDRRYKGDFSKQERALDMSLNGADGENCLNYTIWTYCPDNVHEWGDGWNGEDLSLWSVDDAKRHLKLWLSRVSSPSPTSSTPSTTPPTPPNMEPVLPKLDELQNESTLTLSVAPPPNKVPTGYPPHRPSGSQSVSRTPLFGGSTNTLVPMELSTQSLIHQRQELPPSLTLWQTFALGTRGVRAFSRPYPVKVVGRVRKVDFDVQKGIFRCSVVPPTHRSAEARPGRETATEIFVPLIHYASEDMLVDPLSSSLSVPATSTAALSSSMEHLLPENGKSVLGLDISVSEGSRVEVEGQRVWWWYPSASPSDLPSSLSRTQSEDVWIEIRRTGTVLPYDALIRGKYLDDTRHDRDGDHGICPSGLGCIIM